MDDDLYREFAAKSRSAIVASAGCGKTELIARSTAYCDSPQLILTHTHAGVDTIRARMQRLKIPSSKYHIETIHSFALRYVVAYPKASGVTNIRPQQSEDYRQIIASAIQFMESKLASDILQKSYGGVFVDEYQDCTVDQHELIMKLADRLPCRIVGDPLQGIFDFTGQDLVAWERDIRPNFSVEGSICTPWRWKSTNPQLGCWLTTHVRSHLESGRPLILSEELESAGCFWKKQGEDAVISTLRESLKQDEHTFAICDPAITHKPHSIAKKLKNRFRSIEPMTSHEICRIASSIENSNGIDRLTAAVNFAIECLTAIRQDCRDVIRVIEEGKGTFKTARKVKFFELAKEIVQCRSLKPVAEMYAHLEDAYAPTMIRYQLWHEMRRGLTQVVTENVPSLEESVWQVRNVATLIGRRVPKRCVSRTVLLKGLECDHTIVVDADSLDTKNLYVALTRPSTRLHVLSNSRFLLPVDVRPRCPRCGQKTVPRFGRYGPFLGCSKFPSCEYSISVQVD